jgi:hypothetical protein
VCKEQSGSPRQTTSESGNIRKAKQKIKRHSDTRSSPCVKRLKAVAQFGKQIETDDLRVASARKPLRPEIVETVTSVTETEAEFG